MGKLDEAGRVIAGLVGPRQPLRLLAMDHLAPVPDVPQVPLQRYISPREPTNVQRGLARRRAAILRDVERGMQGGYGEWYFNEPVRQEFIGELGEGPGDERFKLFADMVGATSSSAPVRPNIRKASYYLREALDGRLPVDSVETYGDAVRYSRENPPPAGYGSIGRATDLYWVLKYLRGEQFDDLMSPGAAHKVPSYGENIRGNLVPYTADRHEAVAFGMPATADGEKQLLPSAAYPHAERLVHKWADELGVAPAQFQSARWMGGAERTGVKSKDPSFPHTFEEVVREQARRTKQDPRDVLRAFIKGGGLLSGAAAMTDDELIERLNQ